MTKKNKKGIAPILILILIGVGIIIASQSGFRLGDILSYENVYKANWGSVCCFKTGVYNPDFSSTAKYLDDSGGDKKTCNYNSDFCEIKIQCDNNALQSCSGKYTTSDGITGIYSLPRYATKNFELQVGQSVTFEKGTFIVNEDHTIISLRTQPYSLIQEENGKDLVKLSCFLDDNLKRKTEVTELNNILKGECQNYLTDFVSVATKTYSYNGQEVICQLRSIYEIDNVKFKDGSTKKFQGEMISYVNCCPSENNCGEDFKFNENIQRECSYSTECANGGDPYGISQVTARKFVCENEQCISKDFSVECTSTAVCISRLGEGHICDLSPANFGTCIKSTAPYICGDGYCDIGETKTNCPADCEIECLENEKLVIIESQTNCFIGFPVYWGCDTIIEKKCVEDGTNWAYWITIGAIVLVLFFFRGQILAIIRVLLSKIGVRI